MRIHSNTIKRHSFRIVMIETGLGANGVFIDVLEERISRKRVRSFTLKLAANPQDGRMRRRNTGTHGAEGGFSEFYFVAATREEHGKFFAALYRIDPDMIVDGYYRNAEEFHLLTAWRYK